MYKLEELASHVDGTVTGNPETHISRVCPFENAKSGDITLAASPGLIQKIENCKASAVIVPVGVVSSDKSLIQCENPKLAFARILTLYYAKSFKATGISDHAIVSTDCRISEEVSIHPFVSIGAETVIEDRVTVREGTIIGEKCIIGEGTILYPNVTLYPGAQIGRRVIIHSGTVIGADGFGYVFDGHQHFKVPQIGSVVIGDDVEIGANSCVDRATFGLTIIEKGVKLDNHVHIAHNCTVGENTIIVGSGTTIPPI